MRQVAGLAEDDDGTLIIGGTGSMARFADGKVEPVSWPGLGRDVHAQRFLRDRNGGLWVATPDQGLRHLHQGRTDAFTSLEGLSGDTVQVLLEDREGNVWVGTDAGLDRFRDPAVIDFSKRQGLSNTAYSVLAAKDGNVWIGGSPRLNRWTEGRITIPRTGGPVADGKLGGQTPSSLFQDHHGRLWIATPGGVGYLEEERFTAIRGVPAGVVRSMAEDAAGTLWMANQEAGLVGLSSAHQVEPIPWARLGHQDFATALAADRTEGGLWIGFFRGGIAHVRGGAVRASYGAAEGLGEGYVASFLVEADGTLWVATEGGLSRLKEGRLTTLTRQEGLPCDDVQWVMDDDDARSLWLYTGCGLVRLARCDIDAVRPIRTTVYDLSDGVMSQAGAGSLSPLVSKAPDGKIWFLASNEVAVVDPRRLPANTLPPPVRIEQLVADRQAYEVSSKGLGRLRLPPLVRDLQIDYTALSLSAPEKVRFRYKLEGRDRDWQDAGARRQAFYNDLPPGSYRFRMTAYNNSGLWNEAGTFVDFAIAPAYYQSAWFRAAGVAALLAVLAAAYRLRLRQATRQVRARMHARLEERERIARDLHDTLLQSVQGLILKFEGIARGIPAQDPARQAIDELLDRADEVMAEGRDRVHGLRTGTARRDLPAALEQVAREAARDGTQLRSVVEGRLRELNPIVLEESFAIGREALLNAVTHSGGVQVEVAIAYDPRQLRLRIRDDGRGIAPEVLGQGGREGHWGLPGMRERARRIGARLEIWSRPGAGTEVELTVPAATAYRGVP
jgi:signal transduction histidine kinase/ligand-binding sensor domain-containing protein